MGNSGARQQEGAGLLRHKLSHTGGGHGKTPQAGEQESELLFTDPSPGQGGSRDRRTLITESSSSDGLAVLCLQN